MQIGRLPFLWLFTLASLACAGGQSGGEEFTPSPCAFSARQARAIDLDEATSIGTARSLFEAAMSSRPRTVKLSWSHPDDSRISTDTAVTLTLSGAPTTATASEVPGYPTCTPTLSVDGAVLGFQSADGAFDESIAGTLSDSASEHQSLTFSAHQPATNLVGTYDLDAVARRFDHPQTIFSTTVLLFVQGSWEVRSEASDQDAEKIAEWGGPPPDPIPENGGNGGIGGGGSDISDDGFAIACAGNGGCYGISTGAGSSSGGRGG